MGNSLLTDDMHIVSILKAYLIFWKTWISLHQAGGDKFVLRDVQWGNLKL